MGDNWFLLTELSYCKRKGEMSLFKFKHFQCVAPSGLHELLLTNVKKMRYNLYDLNHSARLVSILVHFLTAALVLFFGELGKLGLNVFGTGVRVSYVTVGAVSLQHYAVKRNLSHHLQVLISFQRAAVEANIEVHLHQFFHFLEISSERMHNTSWKLVPVFSDHSCKISLGWARVKIHRESMTFCKIKVRRKHPIKYQSTYDIPNYWDNR